MQKARLVKLSSGEEMIAEISNQTETHITIKNPVRLFEAQNGLGMMPSYPFCKDDKNLTITLELCHVMFIIDILPDLANHYNTQYGNGLVLATGGMVNADQIKSILGT